MARTRRGRGGLQAAPGGEERRRPLPLLRPALTPADVILGDRVAVAEHTIELAGAPVFYRHAPVEDPTPLYLHSVPTSSDDWLPFLERSGGLAPDLLGFGRSSKAGNLDYDLPAYVRFLEAFLRATEVERVSLVGHGWGAAVGLAFAQRHPDRVARLVLIDAVPLLDGFSWPRVIRHLRRPAVGELLMGAITRPLLARGLRAGARDPAAWPDERVRDVWEQFDQGTQRAILRLHRSIDPAGLAAAGAQLDQLDVPVLVLWGERDPWLDSRFAAAYAARLPDAKAELVTGAGHWPWLKEPAVIDRVVSFIRAGS
jgi:pimeloyl-ACP methyl ester carboxylesterase